tara:strand:- start:262 stop:441 length:180 start_codon:yes stop_codon:yes gene_type:complete
MKPQAVKLKQIMLSNYTMLAPVKGVIEHQFCKIKKVKVSFQCCGETRDFVRMDSIDEKF